jgi:DNA-binding TFAR19-related protein (PDSD5 family)
MNYTSIQISPETRARLTKFKEYTRETYDEVLNKLMSIAELVRKEGELSDETLKDISEARKQYAGGKTFSTKEVLEKLGV